MHHFYSIHPDVLRYQWLVLPGDGSRDRELLQTFEGQPWQKEPPVSRLERSPDEPKLPLGDFPNLETRVLVVSERAYNALKHLLHSSGQVVPVLVEDQAMYLYNTFAIPTVSSQTIAGQCLAGGGLSPLFKVCDDLRGRPYVTNEFVDAYSKAGLAGLLFHKII